MSTDYLPYTDSALFNRWFKGAHLVQKKRKKEQYTGTRKGFKRMMKARSGNYEEDK